MHVKHPTDTTTTIAVSVCPRCGTTGKSGKTSCCGRGGSWFKSCGGDGNTKLQHTWYEGIQACKARSQFKAVIGQQLNGAQQKGTGSSQRVGRASYKEVIAKTAFTLVNTSTPMPDSTLIVTSTYTSENVPIATSAHTLMTNTATNILMTPSIHTSVSASMLTQECVVNVLKITVHINLLFIIVF